MQCILNDDEKINKCQATLLYMYTCFLNCVFFLQDPTASLDLVDLDDTPAPDPVGTFAG